MLALVSAGLLALAWSVDAQSDDAYHPHAAFAFIRTGERTPTIHPGAPVLTALGAQQMYRLGQNLRTRYIDGADASHDDLGIQHIDGLSTNVLDNDQILVRTLDSQYLVASAQALMQGLYPPYSLSNATGDAADLLADGSAIDYPLGGYQHANIQSKGALDPQSIFVQGDQNCPYAQSDAQKWFVTEQFKNSKTINDELYKELDLDWSGANLDEYESDFTYAIKRFDYLSYQYAHDRSVYQSLANDTPNAGVYDTLQSLADEEAWHLWGNVSDSSNTTSLRATGGRTLAASILSQFQKIITDRMGQGNKTDTPNPITLLFGEIEPFISLISLMMLDKRDPEFRAMPSFGSAMLFELFSTGSNASFPASEDDLSVRFYYHNSTGYPKQLVSYPMFGNESTKTDMSWSEFKSAFQGIMVETLKEWCDVCASPSLFCRVADKDDVLVMSTPHGAAGLSPTIAGVIGAMVTLGVASILFALAMLVGGVRLHRVHKGEKSELGGFKGSAKLASDADVGNANGGAPPAAGIVGYGGGPKRGHERVGSWELRQKEFGTDLADSPRESYDAIDDVATRPVQAHHRV
ncbi:phosphoglycerate mutase-like protein [Dothidotthia symphoricarpi CBS 119687]|uniref:Phosphoglycerate mutase-like protein n=1 Tax=Dothidotthia symphoricarpi CBS 119687 TaxID=1392245 RepID=A0A6A6AKR6_9PLEO|nr:phosphoglycerate mutase-like protein [Dothidotthia symphoricarpi CBS 119687]KAF2131514.1 phosphoglycerate mutase-like protein [Dothidotthia symphoricarpi CBS 119687]